MKRENMNLVTSSQSKLSSAINIIDHHLADHASILVGSPSPEVLWKATHDTGIPHLRLISSPSHCVVSSMSTATLLKQSTNKRCAVLTRQSYSSF